MRGAISSSDGHSIPETGLSLTKVVDEAAAYLLVLKTAVATDAVEKRGRP